MDRNLSGTKIYIKNKLLKYLITRKKNILDIKKQRDDHFLKKKKKIIGKIYISLRQCVYLFDRNVAIDIMWLNRCSKFK